MTMEPYAPRLIRSHGIRQVGPWKLKVHSVAYGDGPLDWPGFEPGLEHAEATLPSPDERAGRPGLGFLIVHQGRTGDYVVLAWWDHENELPLRVWVRRTRSEAWREAQNDESICVWDLEVIWAERSAWVATMLRSGEPDPQAYLASF